MGTGRFKNRKSPNSVEKGLFDFWAESEGLFAYRNIICLWAIIKGFYAICPKYDQEVYSLS